MSDEIDAWLLENEKHILGGNKRTLDILVTKFRNEIQVLKDMLYEPSPALLEDDEEAQETE
jgi:hypothetical protein